MKLNFFKIRETSDSFILLKKKTEKVFNSNICWSLWESFLIVIISSAIFGFCVNYSGLNFNMIALPNKETLTSDSFIISVGKSIFILTFLWLMLTLISSFVNQHKHKGDDVICNIAHITALVYVSILPVSLLFLYPFHPIVKSNIWIFFNLFLLLFYSNLFGVFIYSCSEKTANAESLSFVYTAKRLDIKNVLISSVFMFIFIVFGTLYFVFSNSLSGDSILSKGLVALILLGVLGVLMLVGGFFRKDLPETDENPFLTSFYGYGKAFCAFIVGIMLLGLAFKIFGLDMVSEGNSSFYFMLLDLLFFGFMVYLVYETKLVCFDTGYKYSFAENKKLKFFRDKADAEESTQDEQKEDDLGTNKGQKSMFLDILGQSFKADLEKDPIVSFFRKRFENIKISVNTDTRKDPFVIFFKSLTNKANSNGSIKSSKKFFHSIGARIKSAIDFMTFETVFNSGNTINACLRTSDSHRERTIFLLKSTFLFLMAYVSAGVIFAFSKLHFLGFTVRTHIWYYDVITGTVFGAVFVICLSSIMYLILKSLKIKTSFKEMLDMTACSLIPLWVVSFISLAFIKKEITSTILEYGTYVFLTWSISYIILSFLIKYKLYNLRFMCAIVCSLLLGTGLFMGLSEISFNLQKSFNPYYKTPITRVRAIIEQDLPKDASLIVKYMQSSVTESVDLAETSVGDMLEHAKFMMRYKNNDPSNDEFLYSMRMAREMSDNHNWANYLYENQLGSIKKSKDKAKDIVDFVSKEIKEEETNYPFGDSFWQDSVTTFKRKAGTKTDVAVLVAAMLRTNGIPARICTVTPDEFFNNSYDLVEYYDKIKDDWIACYPENKNVKSNTDDLKSLSKWKYDKKNISNIAFYYIHEGMIYPMCDGERLKAAGADTDILPGKYMASYTDNKNIYNYFFEIRVVK